MERELSINETQTVALEMLSYLDQICKQLAVDYCLLFGTTLGAVRHRGFIPWDDDVDVGIEFSDLPRLIQAINDQNGRYRVLVAGSPTDYLHPYPKLVDTTTYVEEPDNRPVSQLGVFVDLFPLYRLNSASGLDKVYTQVFNLFQKVYCQRFVRRRPVGRGKPLLASVVYYAARCVFPIRNPVSLLHWWQRQLEARTSRTGSFIAVPYDFSRILPLEYYFPVVPGEFEELTFPVAESSHHYLTAVYGDGYMTPVKTAHAFHGKVYLRCESNLE